MGNTGDAKADYWSVEKEKSPSPEVSTDLKQVLASDVLGDRLAKWTARVDHAAKKRPTEYFNPGARLPGWTASDVGGGPSMNWNEGGYGPNRRGRRSQRGNYSGSYGNRPVDPMSGPGWDY